MMRSSKDRDVAGLLLSNWNVSAPAGVCPAVGPHETSFVVAGRRIGRTDAMAGQPFRNHDAAPFGVTTSEPAVGLEVGETGSDSHRQHRHIGTIVIPADVSPGIVDPGVQLGHGPVSLRYLRIRLFKAF